MSQIKCKDCKFYDTNSVSTSGTGRCVVARITDCGIVTTDSYDDFYCANAESKDGESK